MLLITGDSFCADLGKHTWPTILSKKISTDVIHCSHSGGSWWATRRKILELKNSGKLDHVTTAIFCHTEGSRIPNVNDIPIGGWIVERTNWLSPNVHKASKLYYEHLHDPEFAVWAQQAWIDECTKLLPLGATAIHIHSFPYTYFKIKINNGVDFYPPLFAISQAEFETDDLAFKFIANGDSRKNHLSPDNNRALANQLYNLIKSKQSTGKYVSDLSDFKIHEPVFLQHLNGSGDIICNGKII